MGLEFKPYFAWNDEERGRRVKRGADEKPTTNSSPAESAQSDVSEESSGGHGHRGEDAAPRLVFVHADGSPAAAPAAAPLGSTTTTRELAPALAAANAERREYAALVASEDENANEYKSFFSIVLDCPQFLGQGETKEGALRHARMLLHYALGAMLLKSESIPTPSTGAELEAKKAAMERDWVLVKLENFSTELVPLQFQPGIDYTARPPESDGEYESDREDEELFELESRMSTP